MNKALFIYIALAALALAVFAIWPELDLMGARYFYHQGGFFGRNDFERFGRDFFRVTPFVVLAAYAALWLAKHRRREGPLGAERPSDDLSHRHDDHWAGPHRQRGLQRSLASSPPDPDPGLQRAGPFHAVV